MDSDPAWALVNGRSKILVPIKGLFFIVLIFASSSGNSQGAPAAGSVEGRVTCNDGGFPARGGAVDLIPLAALRGETSGAEATVPQVPKTATDFDGNYTAYSVPAGDYLVIAHLPGYGVDFALMLALLHQLIPEQQKSFLATFPQVTARAGAAVRQDVVIRRGSAISGRVTFDSGGPLEQTMVQATLISSSLFSDTRGEMKFEPIQLPYMRGQTDDRGVYRIAGLSPGRYRISVLINHHGASSVAGPLTVYAPEVITEAGARVVEVGEGDEIGDMDISIPLRRLHSIAGVVTRNGVPTIGGYLTLKKQDSDLESDVPIQPDGSYRYDLLPSGTYTIGRQDFYTKKQKPGSPGNNTITIQLGDRDVLDANLNFLGGAQSE